MQLEPRDKQDVNHRIFTSVGLSVVLGIGVGQLFDFEDPGKVHFVSITRQGTFADLGLIIAITAMILATFLFVGATFLGAGSRRLFWSKQRRLLAIEGGRKND
jgi:hypothetical protein